MKALPRLVLRVTGLPVLYARPAIPTFTTLHSPNVPPPGPVVFFARKCCAQIGDSTGWEKSQKTFAKSPDQEHCKETIKTHKRQQR